MGLFKVSFTIDFFVFLTAVLQSLSGKDRKLKFLVICHFLFQVHLTIDVFEFHNPVASKCQLITLDAEQAHFISKLLVTRM